jgi:hypothetical protein
LEARQLLHGGGVEHVGPAPTAHHAVVHLGLTGDAATRVAHETARRGQSHAARRHDGRHHHSGATSPASLNSGSQSPATPTDPPVAASPTPTNPPVDAPPTAVPPPPSTPPDPTTTADNQAVALLQQVQTAAANPDKPSPTISEQDSAQIEFLYNLATSAFWGPPQPPPAFAIANLIDAANNGSVSPVVISQVLYRIAVTFDPPNAGGAFPSAGSNPDGMESIFLDVAGEAAEQVDSQVVGDLTSDAVYYLTNSQDLADAAGSFVGSFSGSVLNNLITNNLSGTTVLEDVAKALIETIL